MFATPAIAFHTILSLLAIVAGGFAIVTLIKGRKPDLWIAAFLITMIATDVTGFFLPAAKLMPAHIFGVLSLAAIALALAAHYVFHFAGAWRWIYAASMGVAVYLNFFVLVTQLFLKVPALHALAPNAPDNPEPPFAVAQLILLVIFGWLIWKASRNFRRAEAA